METINDNATRVFRLTEQTIHEYNVKVKEGIKPALTSQRRNLYRTSFLKIPVYSPMMAKTYPGTELLAGRYCRSPRKDAHDVVRPKAYLQVGNRML
jgi:hypothetical protein